MVLAQQKQLWEETPSRGERRTGAAAKPRQAWRFKALILGGILLATAFGLGRAYLAAGVEAKGYQINQVKKEIAALEVRRDRLELETARLRSPARIAGIAEKELSMRQPHAGDYLLLPGEKYRVTLAGSSAQSHASARPTATEATGKNPLLRAVTEALEQWLGLSRRVAASEL